MRVLLKLILDCDPYAAWRAIQSPAVLREVSGPLLRFDSLEPDDFPTTWSPGEHPLRARAGGAVPMGEQVLDISFPETRVPGVRILRDAGHGRSGMLSLVTRWDHRMAIAADPRGTGKTLFRDQLIFEAGPYTAALWPSLWSFWQWRGAQMKRMAPTWASDIGEPPRPGDADTAANSGSQRIGSEG
jgi:hypothetical protein